MENKQPQYKPGDRYVIPNEGSLGLLALGYRGLFLWREKIIQEQKENQTASSVKAEEE